MNTQEKLKAIVVDKLGCSEDEVDALTNLEKDLGADSLDAVEICMEAEKEFNIMVPDEDLAKFNGNFGEIVEYVEAHIQ